MKYFIIWPNALIGHCYAEEGESETLQKVALRACSQSDNKIVLFFDTAEQQNAKILAYSFFTASSKETKSLLQNSQLTGCKFRQFDKVVRDYLNNENGYFPNHISVEDNWWLLCCEEYQNGEYFDMMKWKGTLIVSEEALQFLQKHEIFEDSVEGTIYGPENEVLANRFLVEGEVEDFILNVMPKHRAHIELMRRRFMDEYRRRQGLPLLP